MLHKVDGSRQHEKKLPEPYATAWLSLCGRSTASVAKGKKKAGTDVKTYKCEHCGKDFKKDFALAGK